MATIGERLPVPEDGWKRYDSAHPYILAKGYTNYSNSYSYDGNYIYTENATNKPILFRFKGTKLRLIARNYNINYYGDKIDLFIDGELKATFSEKSDVNMYVALLTEVTGLDDDYHDVEIKLNPSNGIYKGINLDAIDIDESGELVRLPTQIGEQLSEPEEGWQRYDDTHPLIKYEGVWLSEANAAYLNGYSKYSQFKNTNCKIKFSFIGTKVRILGPVYINKPTDIPIIIDGVTETYSQYNGSLAHTPTLLYEKTGLPYGVHTVEIKTPLSVASISNGNIQIDSIDIDADGELIRHDYFENPHLDEPLRKYGLTWFGFDEEAGTVLDKFGGTAIGTIEGNVERVEGWNGKGKAIKFTTNNGKQGVVFNERVIPLGEKTIRFKLRARFVKESSSATSNVLFSVGRRTAGSTVNQNGLIFSLLDSNSTFSYGSYVNNLSPTHGATFTLKDGKVLNYEWLTIMLSYKSGLLEVYINDELYIQTRSVVEPSRLDSNLVLGRLDVPNWYGIPTCEMDDFQVYLKALTPADFLQKRIAFQAEKPITLSRENARVKEIPSTDESDLLLHAYPVHEIDAAVDAQAIDLTKSTTEYEVVSKTNVPLGSGKMFTIPVSDFKKIKIENNE